jgi:hypothetical protein
MNCGRLNPERGDLDTGAIRGYQTISHNKMGRYRFQPHDVLLLPEHYYIVGIACRVSFQTKQWLLGSNNVNSY